MIVRGYTSVIAKVLTQQGGWGGDQQHYDRVDGVLLDRCWLCYGLRNEFGSFLLAEVYCMGALAFCYANGLHLSFDAYIFPSGLMLT